MNKQHFLLTLNKWKQEKNLARLVYRIIKFEEDEECLSYEQICNRAKNFIFTKQQLEDMKQQKEKEIKSFKFEKTKLFESQGCTNISWKNDDMRFTDANGKSFFTTFTKDIGRIELKYHRKIYNQQIQEAINKVLNTNWIKEVKIQSRYSGTGDIIKGSYITKYKATR